MLFDISQDYFRALLQQDELPFRLARAEADLAFPERIASACIEIGKLSEIMALCAKLDDLPFYLEMTRDPDLASEAMIWLSDLEAHLLEHIFAHEAGHHPALIQITAGAGGEDARDFASMTVTEICCYAERSGLDVELLDSQEEGSGLREANLRIRGPMAFGRMRLEAGKRRLVRQSPYGSGGRQTSFCAVTCLPELPKISRRIDPKDLRIETCRDTGPGGQHRNTTDSAVRITHLPTGISAKSTSRSQHENRKIAMSMLAARLEFHFTSGDSARQAEMGSGNGEAGFGGASRSLILSPYQLLRNEITGFSTTAVNSYLHGGEISVRLPISIGDNPPAISG